MAIYSDYIEQIAQEVIREQILEDALDITWELSFDFWNDVTGNLRRSIRIDDSRNAIVIGGGRLFYWRFIQGVPDRLPLRVSEALRRRYELQGNFLPSVRFGR